MSSSDSQTPAYLELPDGRCIAYHYTAGKGPGVVFLGGFRSDMTGSKALYLEEWAQAEGRAFLRLDYTGHGASNGDFEQGCLGDWADDAWQAITQLTEGPQILVGSSMGGWIMLLLLKRFYAENAKDRIAGLVGIAAAPDFTEDLMKPKFTAAEQKALAETGRIIQESPYDDFTTIITQRLIEDGAQQLVLRTPLPCEAPVRLLHGSADPDVPLSTSLQLLEHLDCPDVRLHIVKDVGHRFSGPAELALLRETVASL